MVPPLFPAKSLNPKSRSKGTMLFEKGFWIPAFAGMTVQ